MTPPTNAPATLRAALAATGPRPTVAILSANAAIPLAEMLHTTVLGPDRPRLAGACVMVSVSDQVAAARAMIDCDGFVRRMVVCPPDLKPDHYASVVADAGVTVIVSDHDPAAFAAVPSVPVHRCDHPPLPVDTTVERTAGTEWVLSTSGTSGAPKLVVHSLAALTAAIAPVPPDRVLVWGTFYDIRRYGGMQIFLRAVLAGCTLVLSAADEPLADHLRRLHAAGITHLSGTPSHWRRLLMSSDARVILPAYVRLSGEIADQAVLDGLAEAYPDAKIGHAYASTEAGVGFEVNDGLEGFPADIDRAGPCAMRIAEGSLRIRSPRMASRYLGVDAPPLTDPEGFVDTGDMVERRGDRLFFVGRRGGIINVGGLKVHPEEIEAVINRNDGVRMSLVKSRRSPIMGSVVVADVVLAPGAEPDPVRAAVMAACRASLPVHKVPATIRFVAALEVTAAGKLSRSAA